MKLFKPVLFAALALISQLSTAEMYGKEQAIESSTTYLSLPERLPSTITLAPCDNGCNSAILQLTESSKFFVNRQSVTFSQFKESAARSGLNLSVFFDASTHAVTRVIVYSSNQ